MATHTYHVEGMTCGHCVAAVRDEVAAIDGVTVVEVDLETGRVVVDAASDRAAAGARLDAAVAAAVDEAGYALRSA